MVFLVAGSTVFVEPLAVFELNNELSNLKADEEIEIDQRNNSNGTGSDNSKNEKSLINQRDYSVRVSFDTNYLRQKYLLLNAQQSWFCKIRATSR